MTENPLLRFFRITLVTLSLPFAAHAESPSPAQDAIQQGLDAIQKKDYARAEHSFRDARKKGGPDAYYDIGLAESKISGRELRSICWFAAYLAANPHAANAAEIKARIDSLDAVSKDKIQHLLKDLQQAVEKMPDGEERNYDLRAMVSRWAGTGDFDTAKKIVDLITGQPPGTKGDALCNLTGAYVQVVAQKIQDGDPAGARATLAEAQKTADLITFGSIKSDAQVHLAIGWIHIAQGQIASGDIKGARETLATAQKLNEAVESTGSRYNIWTNIAAMQVVMARAQLKAGDNAGARESLAAAINTTHLLQGDPFNEAVAALQDIAEAQISAGDFPGARASLDAAVLLAHDTPTLRGIALIQVRAKDLAGAARTADRIDLNWNDKFQVQKQIVVAQIKSGDMTAANATLTGASKTAGLIPDTDSKVGAYVTIARAQVKTGDSTGARQNLLLALKAAGSYPDLGQRGNVQKFIAEEQLKMGDKAAAEKIARLIQNPDLKAQTLQEIAAPPKKSQPENEPSPPSLLLPSEEANMKPDASAEEWIWTLRGLDAPRFTYYPDYSNYAAIAAEIQKEPVRNGPGLRQGPLTQVQALSYIYDSVASAQYSIDRMLEIQFKK